MLNRIGDVHRYRQKKVINRSQESLKIIIALKSEADNENIWICQEWPGNHTRGSGSQTFLDC